MASGSGIDVFLTVDRSIEFQQNLTDLNIAVVAMVAPSNRLRDSRPIMARVREALNRVRPGTVTSVGDLVVGELPTVYRFVSAA